MGAQLERLSCESRWSIVVTRIWLVQVSPGDRLRKRDKQSYSLVSLSSLGYGRLRAPKFIAATEAISGKDFPVEPVIARLTLCNAPSESFPEAGKVTINMRYALKSFTPEPVSMRYKVDTLFHELLHIFLSREGE